MPLSLHMFDFQLSLNAWPALQGGESTRAQLRAQGLFRRNLLQEGNQPESRVGRAFWSLPGAGIEPARGLPPTGF